jgi:hypothetical protein
LTRRSYARAHGVLMQSYSPLGNNASALLQSPVLQEVGQSHGKSTAQVTAAIGVSCSPRVRAKAYTMAGCPSYMPLTTLQVPKPGPWWTQYTASGGPKLAHSHSARLCKSQLTGLIVDAPVAMEPTLLINLSRKRRWRRLL